MGHVWVFLVGEKKKEIYILQKNKIIIIVVFGI